ncbi:MAG: hypothetical protein M0R06_22380 [Sphaerochaeta sp.]|jgi:excisionase family DNA binding protein|nr:hypothetical protein [Sphaerochaeta sp.]
MTITDIIAKNKEIYGHDICPSEAAIIADLLATGACRSCGSSASMCTCPSSVDYDARSVFMTVSSAAVALGISEKVLRDSIRKRRVRAVRTGAGNNTPWLVYRADINAFRASGGIPRDPRGRKLANLKP